MYYHVRISTKSNKSYDETKVDLTEEQLYERFLKPYESGLPIIINGKTIDPSDFDRIRLSRSEESSNAIVPRIEAEDRASTVIALGGPSYEWRVADCGSDITDEMILGPYGYKKGEEQKDPIGNVSNKKIFVVHGHDENLKNDIEIFVSRIGLEPIVLHRESDEGLTIIEKFERHSDVAYALILLTPDDVGCSIAGSEIKGIAESLNSRARQNVVFEFGYFVGKLGRDKVCCIYKEGVELPSDVNGLLYKKVDKDVEAIGFGLIKELKAAGLNLVI